MEDAPMTRQALFALVMLGGCSADDMGPSPGDTDTDTDVVMDTDGDTDTEVDSGIETDVMPTDPCLAQPTVVRLGTGELEFESLTDGGTIEMRTGGQDCCTRHLDVSVMVENAPQRVVLEFDGWLEDGTRALIGAPAQRWVALVPAPAGAWQCNGDYVGERVILDHEAFGAVLSGPDADVEPWRYACGRAITLQASIRLQGEGQGELGPVLASDRVRVTVDSPTWCADGPLP